MSEYIVFVNTFEAYRAKGLVHAARFKEIHARSSVIRYLYYVV